MPLLCLFIHLYFCCFVRCKHAAPNFAEIWVWSCAAAVFGCCEVLQITQSANELVGRCVAHAGFSHSFSALIKLTSWYFPIIRKRVFSSRLRLDFISCFVSVINTWTWRGVAVYHQLCSPTTPHPPAAGPAPTGSSLWAALQSSQWLFFRHLTVQYRAQGRVTFDGHVDCFEVKAATFCSCDSFWPPSLTPSPLSLRLRQ